MNLRIVGAAKQWSGTNSPKRTILHERSVPIMCTDPLLTQQYLKELGQSCEPQHVPLVQTAAGVRRNFLDPDPPVILLDESAAEAIGDASLESIVSMLTEVAPIVVVAAPEHQDELSFLITSGAVDFVSRNTSFVPVAAGLVERRIRRADCMAGLFSCSDEETREDFGEILRHEVNNPLTGILGNAELLLAWGDHLPPDALARVETIAELAVRLRETVRRLSNAWMVDRDRVAPP